MNLHPTYDDSDRVSGALLLDDPSPYAWRWDHNGAPGGRLECGGVPVPVPVPGMNPAVDRLVSAAREIADQVMADVSRRRAA